MRFQGVVGWLVVLVLLGSCYETLPGKTEEPSSFSTGLDVGNFVVYTYTGTYTKEPVILLRKVIQRRGEQLLIEVAAQRGNEERHWFEVVTDNPSNIKTRSVTAVYEVMDDNPFKLPNDENADLEHLYEWIRPPVEGPVQSLAENRHRVLIMGAYVLCPYTSGLQSWNKKQVRFELHDCPDFLLRSAGDRYWVEETGQLIYKVDVVDFGRE